MEGGSRVSALSGPVTSSGQRSSHFILRFFFVCFFSLTKMISCVFFFGLTIFERQNNLRQVKEGLFIAAITQERTEQELGCLAELPQN